MKKNYFLLLTFLITSVSFGQVLASDDFNYTDGALVDNGSWANESGSEGTLLVSGGEAIVSQDSGSEDAELKFADNLTSGIITASFDIKVTSSGAMSGTDFEYFAHFSNDTNTNFRSRLDVIAPTAGGDYTLGLSAASSTNDASLTTDFSFGATVTVNLSFNLDTGVSSLTVGSETITSNGSTGETLDAFNLRQSNSSSDETIAIDNLVITFTNTLSLKENKIAGFAIYPNPVSQEFVTISSKSNSSLNIQVFDVVGKQVLNQTVTNNKLNVSSLKSGIYIIKAIQNNAISTKKLVVK
ncbi:T9SS type A sorting domain-containing protein [Algibacter sp. PT7-4]|uniref:T9SS type A sorting domain-containing protein n=1 Tax=Algibacter ulvanivorans TaxID=3400999 RepID=UPI003AAB65A5